MSQLISVVRVSVVFHFFLAHELSLHLEQLDVALLQSLTFRGQRHILRLVSCLLGPRYLEFHACVIHQHRLLVEVLVEARHLVLQGPELILLLVHVRLSHKVALLALLQLGLE